jgi:hypothetical protein
MATTASEKSAPAKEGKSAHKTFWRRMSRPLLFWRRIPTALLVTLVGLVLSAWLLPALTRQWDDRQKAHELKVSLSTAVATADARAMTNALVMAQRARLGGHRHRRSLIVVSPTERAWVVTSSALGARIGALFPEAAGPWDSWRFMVDRVIVRAYGAGAPLFYQPYDGQLNWLKRDEDLADGYGTAQFMLNDITRSDDARLANTIRRDQVWLYSFAAQILGVILSGHPVGYSTTFGDFLHDLIP